MIEKVLHNGVYSGNSDSLNRRIRISNLIALLSIVVMSLYTPFYFYYTQYPGAVLNIFFLAVSLFSFYLIRKRRYITAFFLHCTSGFVYFIIGTLLYGLVTNLHFYMLVMCTIVIALFDNKQVIRLYVLFAITSFFSLLWWNARYEPFVRVPEAMGTNQKVIGIVNLFLLFLIISLFLLFFKNGMLRSQKRVLEQKRIIEEKNRDTTDSIHYAKRIQSALLPGKSSLEKLFPGSFLYFSPKDIVSGDFYWISENDRFRFLAVGDCTGHGVPGALMSVLGVNLLTEIVENKHIDDPAEILHELRSGILYAFSKEGTRGEYKDGMDIAIIRLNKQEQSFSYAAANNPVYHISSKGLIALEANRQPVGYSHEMKAFDSHHVAYEKGDVVVLFTDGFADQFGGPKDKKFMYRPFKELLVKSTTHPEPEQWLHENFENWRGNRKQVDDVCIAGIRL